jgi:hypothetical protein
MATIELCDCENVLLREIATKGMYRKDIALTYAMALRSSEREAVDWRKVNEAIIERWSIAALRYIKDRAWGLARGTIQP